jgi:hypothetical protein
MAAPAPNLQRAPCKKRKVAESSELGVLVAEAAVADESCKVIGYCVFGKASTYSEPTPEELEHMYALKSSMDLRAASSSLAASYRFPVKVSVSRCFLLQCPVVVPFKRSGFKQAVPRDFQDHIFVVVAERGDTCSIPSR